MSLTILQVKQAKPKEKPYKFTDEKGMYLYVTPKDQKYWRMDYRFGGKRKTLALGVYPDVSLAKARDKRDNARQQLQNDLDPNDTKRAAKLAKTQAQGNSFKAVALEWIAKDSRQWSEGYTNKVTRMIARDLFPHIGDRPIENITAPDLLTCLRHF